MTKQPPYIDVCMLAADLPAAPQYALPSGYHMRQYRAGDLTTWLRIQHNGDPYYVATAENFARSMPGDTPYLAERVLFLVAPDGADVGTITAWNAPHETAHDIGQIHWVALTAAAQGRGLAKPMVSAAIERLLARGYTSAWLRTNTRRVPALNLYAQFGFRPHLHSEVERAAWLAVAPLLRYDLGLTGGR